MDRLLALRAKYVLTARYAEIAAIALLFIGVCTFLLLTNVATPALAISPLAEDPHPEPTTHLAGVSQEATVTITNSTDAFIKGQTLVDRSAFPLQNASDPVLKANGDAQAGTVKSIEIRITYAASSTGDPTEAFYTKDDTVAKKEISATSGTLETIVDIRSVFETKSELEEEFGNGVTVTPTIESIVTYQYTSDAGRTQTSTVSVGGAITSVGKLYSLPSGSNQQRHETGPPTAEPISPLVNATIGSIGGAFIVLFVTAIYFGRRGNRQDLGRRIQGKRYAEWVTEIESYTPRGEIHAVQVRTLSGLVNLAIDMNERVLYTAKLDEYIVMDGHTMYKYRSEASEMEGGSEFFGFSEPGEMPDKVEFDTSRGNHPTGLSPNENTAHDSVDTDLETGSDGDGGLMRNARQRSE